MDEAEQIAREKHCARQRLGHKMPVWEGLSDLMREELINRAMELREKVNYPHPKEARASLSK